MSGCKDTESEPPFIPSSIVDFEIDINRPSLFSLRNEGGHAFIANEGDRGIILYRKSENEILAFESNCTYLPEEPCANVSVDQTNLFMIDTCCQSTFDFEGNVRNGPASRPLFLYKTTLEANLLKITDY